MNILVVNAGWRYAMLNIETTWSHYMKYQLLLLGEAIELPMCFAQVWGNAFMGFSIKESI